MSRLFTVPMAACRTPIFCTHPLSAAAIKQGVCIHKRRAAPAVFRLQQGRNATTEATVNDSRHVIFSGIQPTGIPHLGNYLGALKRWVELQDSSPKTTSLLFCIVDLHSITVKQDPNKLRQWKRQAFASLMAVGLDPERCILFEQSKVQAHSELMWILSCMTPLGLLERQTQWKAKVMKGSVRSSNNPESNPMFQLGLLSYPVLQAADILAYRATKVPVGEDQKQHLELARVLASKFNKEYGETFPLPETILSNACRVMSLRDPLSKMSKSDTSDYSRINLTDSPAEIKNKIARAITDNQKGITYDEKARPGVSNLVELLGHMQGRADYQAIAEEHKEFTMAIFKNVLQECVVEELEVFRTNYERILKEGDGFLDKAMQDGARKANEIAEGTLETVKKKVGLA